MKTEYDGLSLNVEDGLNNISMLISAARVFEGTDDSKDLACTITEFVDDYVRALIKRNFGAQNENPTTNAH